MLECAKREAVSLLGARAAHTAQTPSVQVSPGSEEGRLTGPRPLLLHVVGLASPVPTGNSSILFAVWRLGMVCLLERTEIWNLLQRISCGMTPEFLGFCCHCLPTSFCLGGALKLLLNMWPRYNMREGEGGEDSEGHVLSKLSDCP